MAAAASATFSTRELDGTAGQPPVTNLYYLGAGRGYFGLPPYYPFFTDLELGGSVQANALATEQFRTRMITFLNRLKPAIVDQRTGQDKQAVPAPCATGGVKHRKVAVTPG